jgi:hypothetical protein
MTHLLQITAITPAYPEGAWHLDCPVMLPPAAAENSIYLELAGWVVATSDDPVHAIAIYARHLYRSPLLLTVLHQRQDVSQAMGLPPETRTGFHAYLNVLGLQTINTIELFVVTKGKMSQFAADSSYHANGLQPLATIDFTIHATPATSPAPNPLFITSLGRSGSTCIMAALATDPAVIAPEAYPYETKPLAYALHMARLAISPSVPHLSISSQQFLDVPFNGSTNPNLAPADYPRLFEHYRRHGLSLFRAQIHAQFNAAIPSLLHPSAAPDAQPRYIAEKSAPNTMSPMLAELVWPGATELILCRAVAPWIASALAFSRATDRYFGNIADLSDIIAQITIDLDAFIEYLAMRAPNAVFIRFETLIGDPQFPNRLSERLGVTAAAAMAASIGTIPPDHSTRHTPDDPILAEIMATPAIHRLATRFTAITNDHANAFI